MTREAVYRSHTRHRPVHVCNRQGWVSDVMDVLVNKAFVPANSGEPVGEYTWRCAVQECLQKLSELPPEKLFQEDSEPNPYDN